MGIDEVIPPVVCGQPDVIDNCMPNQAAMDLMKKAAAETASIARTMSNILALWNQATEHLLAGNLAEAHSARNKATSLVETMRTPNDRCTDYVRAVRLVDPETWVAFEKATDTQLRQGAIQDVAKMSPSTARAALRLYEAFGMADDDVAAALRARIELG